MTGRQITLGKGDFIRQGVGEDHLNLHHRQIWLTRSFLVTRPLLAVDNDAFQGPIGGKTAAPCRGESDRAVDLESLGLLLLDDHPLSGRGGEFGHELGLIALGGRLGNIHIITDQVQANGLGLNATDIRTTRQISRIERIDQAFEQILERGDSLATLQIQVIAGQGAFGAIRASTRVGLDVARTRTRGFRTGGIRVDGIGARAGRQRFRRRFFPGTRTRGFGTAGRGSHVDGIKRGSRTGRRTFRYAGGVETATGHHQEERDDASQKTIDRSHDSHPWEKSVELASCHHAQYLPWSFCF